MPTITLFIAFKVFDDFPQNKRKHNILWRKQEIVQWEAIKYSTLLAAHCKR